MLINKIIKNKTIGICLFGKSIVELEDRIGEFKDKDICWVSLNAFDIIEKNILSKINKNLDIIYCLALHRTSIETNVQISNIKEALDKNTLIVTNNNLFIDTYNRIGFKDFSDNYKNKVVFLDDIKNKENISLEKFIPRLPTICYILFSLIIHGASKIILFGFDGCEPNVNNAIGTYYKYPIMLNRRVLPDENLDNLPDRFLGGVSKDTLEINNNFLNNYKKVKNSFNLLKLPTILNCSPESKIKVFKIINYNEALKEMEI